MIPTAVQILMSLVAPAEPLLPHVELEHAHWDREAHTWRLHEEPEVQAAA